MKTAEIPTLKDVNQALQRIKPYIHKTPIFTSSYFDRKVGANLFFKCENFQKVGAFKIRGATNFILQLSTLQATKGVVTHSSGNHGQAVAAAAKVQKIPATVVMPESSAEVKRAAVSDYGGKVKICPDGDKERHKAADQFVVEGATLIHPYDHPWIVSGQGTLAIELFEQVSDLDVVIVPVGGGGCLSGVTIVCRGLGLPVELFGAEPESADDAARSLVAGRLIPSLRPATMADGLRTSLSPLTFSTLFSNNVQILTVSEEQILAAMLAIWTRMKLVVEPSAAVSLAAVFAHASRFRGRRIGIVLTGGNVDLNNSL